MFRDNLSTFADNVSLDTGGTGLQLVGDVIDLGTARNIGVGYPVYIVILFTETIDSSGDSATVEFVLASDDAAAIAEDGSATEHFSSGEFTVTTGTEGTKIVFTVPPVLRDFEQYVGILANVGGEAVTAGAISAFVTLDDGFAWQAYPEGNN